MRYINKNRFSLKQVVIMLTVAFLGIAALSYAVDIPNQFTQGTTISATEMNANFAAVKMAVDALQQPRSIIIPAAAFVPYDETLAYTKGNDGFLCTDSVMGVFYASLPIPSGHTIKEFELLAFDKVNTGHVAVQLRKGEVGTLALVSTTDAEADCDRCLKTATLNEVISSNAADFYRVRVYISEASLNLGFYAVKVTYQ